MTTSTMNSTQAALEAIPDCDALPSATESTDQTDPLYTIVPETDMSITCISHNGDPDQDDQPEQKLVTLPPLTEKEYTALKDDIRVHGIQVPIVCDQTGAIIDGHHRRRIADELRSEGITVDYQSIIVPGLSATAIHDMSMRLNLSRRHISHTQMTDLEAHGDAPTLDTGTDKTGRRQPAKKRRLSSPSVITKNNRETKRALQALDGFRSDVLPSHTIDVRRLERIRRETKTSAQAAIVPAERTAIGTADIRFGHLTTALSDVADSTVDLVLTDPPYGREHMHVWGSLGDLAARVLRPGGLLVTYSGQAYLPEVMAALAGKLEYVWVITALGKGAAYPCHARRVNSRWKPILVFAKPPLGNRDWVPDLLQGDGPEKELHDWQQSESEARALVERYSRCNDLIVDPFIGSGTTAVASVALGRRIIGCDVDPAAVQKCMERLHKLMPVEL